MYGRSSAAIHPHGHHSRAYTSAMARRIGRHEGARDVPDEIRGGAQLAAALVALVAAVGIVGSSVAWWAKGAASTISGAGAVWAAVVGLRVRRSSPMKGVRPDARPPDPNA